MMKILITGSSNGIGYATALKFLNNNYEVYGLDLEHNESLCSYKNYHEYICDVSIKESLPELIDVNYLFINAGAQNTQDDIVNNLYSAIYTTEKYGFQDSIKSILFNASVSAHNGAEFPYYVASKGGMLPYCKHIAARLSKRQIPVNSLSCGGVVTELNKPVMDDEKLWNAIMNVTPMKKWASADEIAEWVYFLLVVNKSATGIDIVIDNGEMSIGSSCNFIWPD